MPPHRDWTRRGAGRALLYWPLTAFLLVAAFPAYSVPLVVVSGILLLSFGLVGSFAGKRWRARRLARARRVIADVAEPVLPAVAEAVDGRTVDGRTADDRTADDPAPTADTDTGADAWPTGRHARRRGEVLDPQDPAGTPAATPGRPGAARRDAA